ncbi:MAG: nitrilase-related carbon-nitrogen hydrolase [Candidatus Gastranaerophilaceae bacterium]|nr:nitrilase-related carbon-nitrogen hydrolase [Candidatus Gastranaerophilaceae bacterium]
MGKLEEIKISALQMSSVVGEIEQNRNKLSEIVSKELEYDTDFLVLPEVWTVGWSCEDFSASAEDFKNSQTVKLLSDIAKKYSVNILGGSLIEKGEDGKLYNTCPVINRKGELVTKYSKMHLYTYCGCTEGHYIETGKNPVMVNLDGVNIGLTICYDIRFPEIFRAYRKKNVDLLVNMAAWGSKKPIPWETLTRCRAIENQAYMVALTQSGQIKGDDWNIGHSRIFDYVGETVTEIKDQKEGLMTCKINFDKMYEYRNSCTILNDIHEKYEVRVI